MNLEKKTDFLTGFLRGDFEVEEVGAFFIKQFARWNFSGLIIFIDKPKQCKKANETLVVINNKELIWRSEWFG